MYPLRVLLTYIRGSTQREKTFEEYCRAAEIKPNRLKTECKTRWNSTFDTLERMSWLQKPLLEYARKEYTPEKEECEIPRENQIFWKQMACLLQFLEPFNEATLESSGDNYPTISSQVPLFNKLMDKTDKAKVIIFFSYCVEQV